MSTCCWSQCWEEECRAGPCSLVPAPGEATRCKWCAETVNNDVEWQEQLMIILSSNYIITRCRARVLSHKIIAVNWVITELLDHKSCLVHCSPASQQWQSFLFLDTVSHRSSEGWDAAVFWPLCCVLSTTLCDTLSILTNQRTALHCVNQSENSISMCQPIRVFTWLFIAATVSCCETLPISEYLIVSWYLTLFSLLVTISLRQQLLLSVPIVTLHQSTRVESQGTSILLVWSVHIAGVMVVTDLVHLLSEPECAGQLRSRQRPHEVHASLAVLAEEWIVCGNLYGETLWMLNQFVDRSRSVFRAALDPGRVIITQSEKIRLIESMNVLLSMFLIVCILLLKMLNENCNIIFN